MKTPTPQRLLLRFFRWFCHPNYAEDIEGDLIEKFHKQVKTNGVKNAQWLFLLDVLRLFRIGIIRPSEGTYRLNQYGMFKNYLKVSIRSLSRNKTYTTINLFGLVMSLGIAMALYWIVQFEWSFDNYHNDNGKLYQIIGVKEGDNGSSIPFGAISALRENFPEVEIAVSVHRLDPSVIEVDKENLKQENVYFVHPEVFDILKIKWIAGSPELSFSEQYQVVLDQPTALRLFGNEEPLGKVIYYDNSFKATVSGIIEQVPVNSDFQFQMIFSMDSHPWEPKEDQWGGGDSSFKGLLLLKASQNKAGVEDRLTKIGQEFDEFYYDKFEFRLINSIHLDADNDPFNYYTPNWLLEWLLYIGLFLVLIACMNFINLATVQLVLREKEISVRKLLGSSRSLLMLQFLTETAIMVLIGMVLSIGLSHVIINYANQLLNTNITGMSWWSSESISFIMLVTLGVTLVAGLYPALTISEFQPIRYFQKKTHSLTSSKVSLRQVLVVLQFVIVQIMVVAIITGKKQVEYFKSKDLGFDQSGVVMVDMPEKGDQIKREKFRKQLSQHSQIEDVSFGLTPPSSVHNHWWADFGNPRFTGTAHFRTQHVDINYFDFFDLKLLAGRTFLPSDTNDVTVVNKMVSGAMGFSDPENAIGEYIEGWPGKLKIIGVIEDFHSQRLHDEIVLHAFLYQDWNLQTANIRINQEQSQQAIAAIESHWKDIFPQYYFGYEYLTDHLQYFYESDRKFSNFLMLFAIVSILIGCMGLYGLIYFVCLRRTKEIGVRKVLGAKLLDIIAILSQSFIKLVGISILLACPLVWYFMDLYLSNYAHGIIMSWDIYGLAAILSIAFALLPILLRSQHAANRNPVLALRNE